MKRLHNILGAALLAALTIGGVTLAQNVWIHRNQWTNSGLSGGFSYFRDDNVPSPSNGGVTTGELGVRLNTSGGDHTLEIYQGSSGSWEALAQVDDGAFGTLSATGDVTLGSDEDDLVTVNSPVVFEVVREDFDGPNFIAADFTNGDFGVSVADTEANVLMFQNLNLYYRVEIAFGGTFTPSTFVNTSIDTASTENRVFKVSDATIIDATDNDALDFIVGGSPTHAVLFDEDSGESAYCEASIRIDDISDLTANDLYFGFFLAAAIDDTFGYEGADTWAAFSVLDNAGDLVIATELNGGTHAEDDSGETWADDETLALRVTMSADSVAFHINGTAVTQTLATLNADNGDQFVCRFGYRSSGTDAGVEVNYVEIGRAQ